MKRSLTKSKEAVGFWFILPWVIGFFIFFLQPIVQLVHMSFTGFELNEAGFSLLPLDDLWSHYKFALREDPNYPTYLIVSVTGLLSVPLTVFFSLFSALLLSHSFKGRTAMRMIFFLPLIISASVISNIVMRNAGEVVMDSSGSVSSLFDTAALMEILFKAGFPQQIISVLSMLITNIADLVWKSTVQVFVFLVAILAIPKSYYEVAQIEGATAWETFWKVTFPVSLPYVLVNTVYTVIDSFSSFGNSVIRYIADSASRNLQYDYAAAMSWIYFIIMIAVLGFIFLIFKPFLKRVQ